ncbi:hypothetical protein [Mycoplasmopsis pulmonis]|uniref:hypothetical protein n=1 Tax=Mycoplasmopsis pulmonis TaxID=2107 RepID=UPI001004ED19|nr:hypothetical protein [Mycoplasmopsis pulmonis]VEU68055.1 Uncharacterised protein [Mycoplasmopsis pulmonis]
MDKNQPTTKLQTNNKSIKKVFLYFTIAFVVLILLAVFALAVASFVYIKKRF